MTSVRSALLLIEPRWANRTGQRGMSLCIDEQGLFVCLETSIRRRRLSRRSPTGSATRTGRSRWPPPIPNPGPDV